MIYLLPDNEEEPVDEPDGPQALLQMAAGRDHVLGAAPEDAVVRPPAEVDTPHGFLQC